MAGTKVQADGSKLIESIGADKAHQILGILGIDLSVVSGQDTIDAQCEWQCSVEKVWWPIQARQLSLTDLYAVRWTYAEDAGVDNVQIVEIVDAEVDQETLSEWLREIAADCGSCNGNVR